MSFTVLHNVVKTGSRYRVMFGVTGDVPAKLTQAGAPRLSVSRRPDHSFYTIDQIHRHGNGGPSFNTEAEAKLLIDRVNADVQRILNGRNPETEATLRNRGEVCPKTVTPPAPPKPTTVAVNNPPSSAGAVAGTGGHQFTA